MIVYTATKEAFLTEVSDGRIEKAIETLVFEKLKRKTPQSEFTSWKNSLQYMFHVLNTTEIPMDAGVAIEYNIPRTNNRIDFIVSGQNSEKIDHMILVELKQWSEIQLTEEDGIVITRFQKGLSREPHPSYQAWSYATLLEGFNQTVYDENIQLKPCAYLHNHIDTDVITNNFYKDYLDKAPAFCSGEKSKLQEFIKRFVKYGDKSNILYRIDNGKIKPSKALADSLVSLMKGNQEFIMIDTQKVVYERSKAFAVRASTKGKIVYVVEGGPGTGKSVIAVNLLVNLTKMGLLAQYVSKNAAPRDVYESKLTGEMKKTRFANLFTSSGTFHDISNNSFDALIVDEAHRLNARSGMFQNYGENQVKEIINASKFSVFFLDEDQQVHLKDIGSKEEVIKWAKFYNAKYETAELLSQFRCAGEDGYLAWLDKILQIRDTANSTFDKKQFHFQIVSNPAELREIIFDKNKENNKARLVAGYCWNWKSKKDPKAYDISFPEYNLKMKWNRTVDGNLWILKKETVQDVGCIHTCQGLEVDYIGVIIGKDLIVRNGEVITKPEERDKDDRTIFGYKKLLKENFAATTIKLDSIIKNTYRTLMTRGMKGCYVYFVDKETEEYFKNNLKF